MQIFNTEISPLKLFGGIGTIIGAFLGINGLYSWYSNATMEKISGSWELTETVEQTSYSPYLGMRLGYKFFVEQNDNIIKGTGEKITENDNNIPPLSRTPIEVTGRFDGTIIELTTIEKGKKRETRGMITLKSTNDKKVYEGTFITTAANCKGKCRIELSN